jgi:gluconokinase
MIVVVAGIAGSGKTTVGELLAERMGWVFADGDRFHPPANVAKMHDGIPLTDADRVPWLKAIGGWLDEQAAAGRSAVLACSALKRSYRDLLLGGRPRVKMVFLVISHDDDEARLNRRVGHFFPEKLLDSQFAALELPEPEEGVYLVPALGTPAEITDQVMDDLGLVAP